MKRGGVRAMVHVPLDRCRFSGNFGIRHFALT